MTVTIAPYAEQYPGGMVYDVFVYMMSFLTLAEMNALRLVCRCFYAVCSDPHVRRKLYRKAVDDFELLSSRIQLLSQATDTMCSWVPVYLAAREAWVYFSNGPRLENVWGTVKCRGTNCNTAHPFFPIMHDPEKLYDNGEWYSLEQWQLEAPRLKRVLKRLRDAADTMVQSRTKRVDRKRKTLKRAKLPKTKQRINREIAQMEDAREWALALLQQIDYDIYDCLEPWTRQFHRLFWDLPQGWIDGKEGFNAEPGRLWDRIVDERVSSYQVTHLHQTSTLFRNHAACVKGVMCGDNTGLIAMFNRLDASSNLAVSRIAAIIDDNSVFQAIETHTPRFRHRFRDNLVEASAELDTPNLDKWLFESAGILTLSVLDVVSPEAIGQVFLASGYHDRRHMCESLIEWDRPALFQTLYSAHDLFRQAAKVIDEEAFVCFLEWEAMPCTYDILCAGTKRLDIEEDEDKLCSAMEKALLLDGKTWDNVYRDVKDEATWRDGTEKVYRLKGEELSPESVSDFCVRALDRNRTDVRKVLKIARDKEGLDPVKMLASSSIQKAKLKKAAVLFQPRHYCKMMTIAIKQKNFICIDVLLDLCYVPTKAQAKAISKLHSKDAKRARAAVAKDSNRFIIP